MAPLMSKRQNKSGYGGTLRVATGIVGGRVEVRSLVPGIKPLLSSTFTTRMSPANQVMGVLLTQTVFEGDTVVSAMFRVTDGTRCSALSLGAEIEMMVSAEGVATRTETAFCRGDLRSKGRCMVTVAIDSRVFAQHTPAMAVAYRIQGHSFKSLGLTRVASTPQQIGLAQIDSVAVELPHRPLYPEETIVVNLFSRFDKHLQAAVVEISTSEGLEITNILSSNQDLEIVVTKNQLPRGMVFVVAVLRRKGSLISRERQHASTNERLCFIALKAAKSVSLTTPGHLRVKLQEGQTFDMMDNQLMQQAPSILRGRDGVRGLSNTIYFAEDSIVGILPYTSTLASMPTPAAAEIFNTAKLTGTPIEMLVVVEGVRQRGGVIDISSDSTVSCRTTNPHALHTRPTKHASCTAVLNGQEVRGGLSEVVVAKNGILQSQVVFFRTYMLDNKSIALTSSHTKALRPIAGFYNQNDGTCKRMHFQEAQIAGTASFTDGLDVFIDYDITALLRLISSHPHIATVHPSPFGPRVRGFSAGLTTISILGYLDADTSIKIEVANETDSSTHLIPVGLDYVIFSSLGQLSFSPELPNSGFPRDTTVEISIPETPEVVLKREGQSARIAVAAVLDDGSRLPLTEENGLVIVSTNRKAVLVDQQGMQRVYVPKDPLHADGSLLQASWQPPGPCSKTVIATQGIFLRVEPDLPSRLEVKLDRTFIVAGNDPAAAAGAPSFSTTASVRVYAFFQGDRRVDVTFDSRTSFTSSDPALFLVGRSGVAVSNTNGTTGAARVVAVFRGAVGEKLLPVAKFLDLLLSASPFPRYAGSRDHQVKQLRPIACTSPKMYQKASMSTTMILTNGESAIVSGVEYAVTPASVVSELTGVVSPMPGASGIAQIRAEFTATVDAKGHATQQTTVTSSKPWEIKVTQKDISIRSIDNFRLTVAGTATTTLSGVQGIASGQIALGVTMDDGTKFERAVDAAGTHLKVVRFESSNRAALAADHATGAVRLTGNSAQAVQLIAIAGSCTANPVSSQVLVHANLQPAMIGDVDLGLRSGAPLQSCRVGEIVRVPIAVNTGSRVLSGFEMSVWFSSTYLRYLKYASSVKVGHGKADVLASLGTGDSPSQQQLSINGLIQNSNVKGTQANPYILLTIAFECVNGGNTLLGGSVLKLVEAETNDQIGGASKRSPVAFVAGSIPLWIQDGNRGRRSPERAFPSTHNRRQADKRNGQENPPALWRNFDANCDGEFGVDDGAVIQSFVSFSNAELRIDSNPAWARFQQVVSKCNITYNYDKRLDVDGNNAVTLLDGTYLQNVLAGYYYLYDLVIKSPKENSCQMSMFVRLQGVSADGQTASDPQDIDVFADIATKRSEPAIDQALRESGQLVKTDKGSSNLFGGLVRMSPGQADPQVFEFALADLRLSKSTDIMVSPLLVKHKSVTDVWLQHNHPFLDKLMSYPKSKSTWLSGSLSYTLEVFERSGAQRSTLARFGGYSPQQSVTLQPGSCKSSTGTAAVAFTANASTSTRAASLASTTTTTTTTTAATTTRTLSDTTATATITTVAATTTVTATTAATNTLSSTATATPTTANTTTITITHALVASTTTTLTTTTTAGATTAATTTTARRPLPSFTATTRTASTTAGATSAPETTSTTFTTRTKASTTSSVTTKMTTTTKGTPTVTGALVTTKTRGATATTTPTNQIANSMAAMNTTTASSSAAAVSTALTISTTLVTTTAAATVTASVMTASIKPTTGGTNTPSNGATATATDFFGSVATADTTGTVTSITSPATTTTGHAPELAEAITSSAFVLSTTTDAPATSTVNATSSSYALAQPSTALGRGPTDALMGAGAPVTTTSTSTRLMAAPSTSSARPPTPTSARTATRASSASPMVTNTQGVSSSTTTAIAPALTSTNAPCRGKSDPAYCGSLTNKCATSVHARLLCPATCRACSTGGQTTTPTRPAVSTEPQLIQSRTATSSSVCVCHHRNHTYSNGDVWSEGCATCFCHNVSLDNCFGLPFASYVLWLGLLFGGGGG